MQLVSIWLIAMALLAAASPAESRALKIAVTIAPLEVIVKKLGGEGTEVYVIIRPGQSPHGYEPTPGLVRQIASSDLLVMAGLGLDNWILKIAKAGGKDGSGNIVDCSMSINPKELIGSSGHESHEKGHDHGGQIANPHWWLDPILMAGAARMIGKRMAEYAPAEEKAGYEARLTALERELMDLDAGVKRELMEAKGGFVAFHGAWDYFARRYGLRQVGVIEESPGKSPSAKRFGELAGEIKKLGVGAVMAEPQFSQKLAQALAEEAGVRLGIADPLGGVPGREGYFEMMKFNASSFAAALK